MPKYCGITIYRLKNIATSVSYGSPKRKHGKRFLRLATPFYSLVSIKFN